MKILNILFYNLSLFCVVLLYSSLIISQFSIIPKFQPTLMKTLEITAGSMPISVAQTLIIKPIFIGIVAILCVSTSLLIYKKEGAEL